MSTDLINIKDLSKVYDNGFQALKKVNLDIKKGEIIALLGPNGAGKTTLISIICGIVTPSSGKVTVDDFDIIDDYRETRSRIGLVPQELTLELFETVFNNVSYSRGLNGKKPNPKHIEKILKDLSMWDKKDLRLRELSGGMKRRVLIAKALSHEPSILFLDEPTAGVDVELRRDMWKVVEDLRKTGVTIILTTHYIEEAEEISDRVGFINEGQIVLVENTKKLVTKLGNNKLVLSLPSSIKKTPSFLNKYSSILKKSGRVLEIHINKQSDELIKIINLLKRNKFKFLDFDIKQRSLESIFVNYIRKNNDKL